MIALVSLDSSGLDEVSAAFAYIHVIEDQLIFLGDRGYRVAVHQRNARKWMRVPLMLNAGWTSAVHTPDSVASEATLDEIESLSSFLDGKVLSTDGDRLQSLRGLIDQADALIEGDSTIDSALASYIRRLIAAIRRALDDEEAGRLFDFTSAVDRLRVAFQAAAESAASPEEKGLWRTLVEQITVGVGTSLAVEIGKRILGIDS